MALTEESFIELTPHIGVIKNATNIGVFSSGTALTNQLWLCDSGSDNDAAKHIFRIVQKKFPDAPLTAVINTHSHADHCGGNAWFVKHTGCGVWATAGEKPLIEHPDLEPALIWGGFPIPELRSKFYEAQPTVVTRVIKRQECIALSATPLITVEQIPLPGHYLDMSGYLVTDTESGKKALFLGDAIYGRSIIKKYWIPFLFNQSEFKKTLEVISAIQADWFIPSHGDIITSVSELAELNMIAVLETEDLIFDILKTPHTAEEVLKIVADRNGIPLGYAQFVLIGSTVRSYLSCMYEAGKIFYRMSENKMLWEQSAG
jgi:glyoxylase-like metal-dependent hydrolase (beta-lactamase superfamily II)